MVGPRISTSQMIGMDKPPSWFFGGPGMFYEEEWAYWVHWFHPEQFRPFSGFVNPELIKSGTTKVSKISNGILK